MAVPRSVIRQRTRIKICCIASIDEAELAVAAGADAIGLVSAMPSGPGPIGESLIADIAKRVPRAVGTFLLTCETTADAIAAQHGRCLTTTIQLVDRIEQPTYRTLCRELRAARLVQVVHVLDDAALAEAKSAEPWVDAVLLDSGNPRLAVKELGGTGRTHDWEISARIRAALTVPVFLAGGLRAENVRAAIRQVRPYGVDVCSGVRSDGLLDEAKLRAFVEAARNA
ncbi:MAG: phosphoribosylanthranilate isomerase [Gemmatimonadaceae bacterium]